MKDDDLKRRFGINVDRCDDAYAQRNGDTESLRRAFSANFFQPSNLDLDAMRDPISDFLSNGQFRVVIPMRERGPVIRPVLATIVRQVAPSNITVIENGSDDDALNEVRRWQGVRLVYRDDVLDTLDWQMLLRVLNLQERPTKGKGLAMLAVYLFESYLAEHGSEKPLWLCQHAAQ